MVLRIEYILLISLVVLFGFIITEKPRNLKAIESNVSQEILFENFSLVELTEQGVENQLIASLATKYKGDRFEFRDINITEKEHIICAKEARYENKIIYLKDNILLKRADGLSFKADELRYNIKDKIAHIDSKFLLDINSSSYISGRELLYDFDKKEISANMINATISQ